MLYPLWMTMPRHGTVLRLPIVGVNPTHITLELAALLDRRLLGRGKKIARAVV